MTEPAAAVILSRAQPENACALTFSATPAGRRAKHLDRLIADRTGLRDRVRVDRAAVGEQRREVADNHHLEST